MKNYAVKISLQSLFWENEETKRKKKLDYDKCIGIDHQKKHIAIKWAL